MGGSGDHNFFLQIFFSLGKMSFHVEFHHPGLPGTGEWWWVGGSTVSLVFCFGPNLGSDLDLDQAEQ